MQIAGFILVIQTILFLVHFIIYKGFVKFFSIGSANSLLTTRIIFIILSVSFLFASSLAYKFYGPFGRTIYSASAIWLGTTYWLFFASVLSWLTYFGVKFFKPEKNILAVGQSLLILAVIISAYGIWNSYQTKIRQVTVTLPNLPKEWENKKAVLVSDTHFGNFRNMEFSKKISKLISEQNPDIVLVPGDFYDGPPANFEELAKPFGKIKSTYGVYFAAGNHEEFGDSSQFLNALKKAGVNVLDNEIKTINGLQIIGVGYSATIKAEAQKTILDSLNINSELPSILIKHAPTHIPIAEEAGIGLQVSGHTHLGQVYPLSFITKKVYGKFHYGLNKLNQTWVLTTSGAGTWGPPQRVGTNSEIFVITFN